MAVMPYTNPPSRLESTDPQIGPNISPNEKQEAKIPLAMLFTNSPLFEYVRFRILIMAATLLLIHSAPAVPLIIIPTINGAKCNKYLKTNILRVNVLTYMIL